MTSEQKIKADTDGTNPSKSVKLTTGEYYKIVSEGRNNKFGSGYFYEIIDDDGLVKKYDSIFFEYKTKK